MTAVGCYPWAGVQAILTVAEVHPPPRNQPAAAKTAVNESRTTASELSTEVVGMRFPKVLVVLLLLQVLLMACSYAVDTTPADRFWKQLSALCGQAYAGTVVEAPQGDTTFTNRALIMHVRTCNDSIIRIPFHVGEDRSRTWVLTRTPAGVRLKHDHRHADGTEDAVTQYGGDSRSPTQDTLIEFPADSVTVTLIPAAATNVWSVGVDARHFVYALRREGTDRRYRIEFDLAHPVPAPPSPW